MSKNITIQEGGVAKALNSIKKIQTAKESSGNVLWIPEDEANLKTKSVSKNGTYKASDDNAYGYSQFTVSGVGKATGTKPVSSGGDGNEYSVSTDEETGNLVEKKIPSYIKVTTPPTKTQYQDGESVDITGMVVTAYTADNNIWEDETYIDGIIPTSEITIDPTTAEYSGQSDINQYESPSGDFVVDGTTLHGKITATDYEVTTQWQCISDYLAVRASSPITIRVANTDSSGAIGMAWTRISGNASHINIRGLREKRNINNWEWGTSHSFRQVTIDNKTAFVDARSPEVWQYALEPYSPSQTDWDKVAWYLQYGGMEKIGGAQTITAKWPRIEDSKELTDTFDITVTPSSNNNSNNIDHTYTGEQE